MSVFTALNNTKKIKENLTLHHMGKILLVNLPRYNLKSGGLHLKSFYHLKNLGSTSVFCATDDLPRAHCDETEFRTFLLHGSLLYEPPYDQTNKMTSAPSEDSDQPGHPSSLTRVFAVRIKKTLGPQLPIVMADALVDLILHWVRWSFCLFCSAAAHM